MATDAATEHGVVAIPLKGGVHRRLPAAPGPLSEFIAGPENALLPTVVDALLEGSESDGSHSEERQVHGSQSRQACRFSPIVLQAPAGYGKSHLCQGLVEQLNSASRSPANPSTHTATHTAASNSARRSATRPKRAQRLTGADFARAITDAYQTDSLGEFRDGLAGLRLFVLDDLEELDDKPHAQQQLSVLLDAMSAHGTNVVVTTKTAPGEARNLDRGLTSRLSQGLLLSIERPGEAAREELLRKWAAQFSLALEPAELQRLSEASQRFSPAQTQGLLTTYAAYAHTEEILNAADRIDAFFQEQGAAINPRPTLKQIALQTAKLFQVTQRELCGPTRRQAVVKARGVAMYVARKLDVGSLERIGQHFGNRDHTTVMHACRRTEEQLQLDPHIGDAVAKLLLRYNA